MKGKEILKFMREIKKISLLFASVALLVVTLFSGNNEAKADTVKVVVADGTVQKTPKSLSLTDKQMEFYEGDTFTLGTSAKLTVTYEDSTTQVLEEANANLSFTIDGKKLNIGDKLIASEHNGKMVKVSYTENGTTKSARGYTIDVIPLITVGEGTWELVKDNFQLVDGDKIILASAEKGKTASKIVTTSSTSYFVDVDTTFDDNSNILTLNPDTYIMELSGNTDAWTFKNGNGSLLGTDDFKNIEWDSKGVSTWKIDIASNGYATITSTGTGKTAGVIKYSTRTNSTRFTTYDAAYTTAVVLPQIYKFVEKSESDTAAKFIEDWAALRAKGGDQGICYYLTKETRAELDAMISRYSKFTGDDKAEIDNTSDGGTTIANTIEYVSSLLAKLDNTTPSKEESGLIISSIDNYDKSSLIALFVVLGIITISGYFIIEKKKSIR